MTGSARFSSLVQCFFTKHLCEHKQVSPRTVTAYRDTFRFLFTFVQKQTGKTPSSLELSDLDAPGRGFLTEPLLGSVNRVQASR